MKPIATAALIVGLSVAGFAGVMLQRASADAPVEHLPAEPASRTSVAVPPSMAPPPVPAAADSLSPMTFTVTTIWEGTNGTSRRTTQIVTRTTECVRLVLEGGRREWWFERNPVHPERVSGSLVDHDARQVLRHQDSELRSALQLRGWGDVVMMRFDPRVLPTLRDTGERKTVDGASFAHYTAADPSQPGVIDVWWSDEQLLPERLSVREANVVMTSTIARIERLADPASLAELRLRFAEYDEVDVSDAADHRH